MESIHTKNPCYPFLWIVSGTPVLIPSTHQHVLSAPAQRTVWASKGPSEGTVIPHCPEHLSQLLRLSKSWGLAHPEVQHFWPHTAHKDSVRAHMSPRGNVRASAVTVWINCRLSPVVWQPKSLTATKWWWQSGPRYTILHTVAGWGQSVKKFIHILTSCPQLGGARARVHFAPETKTLLFVLL